MLSPQLFQTGGNNYDENIEEIINGYREKKNNSHTNLLDQELSSCENDEDSVVIETNDDTDRMIVNSPRQSGASGSCGTISNRSNSSARRQGTIIPPTLKALNQAQESAGPRSRLGTEICECGHSQEEHRRHSTGSYEDKYYFVGGGNLVSDHRPYSEQVHTWHGKYSLVADDTYVVQALQCCRYRMRRNALCDPFRLPMPQKTREKLEKDNERRKSSVVRKVSQFLTVALDLNREEDLI